jgi:molecular chaperone DnaJ
VGVQEWLEKDFYRTLGVPSTASTDEIKKAYKQIARDSHPDRNPGDAKAEERFKEASEAHAVLSDPKTRAEYDEARKYFAGGRGPFGPGGPGGPGGAQFDLGDLQDLFGRTQGAGGSGGLGDLFGTIFSQTAGRGQPRTSAPRRGADVESEVRLGFSEAVQGVTVPLRLTSAAPCQTCRGTGAKEGTVPRVCPSCEGTGHVSRGAGGAFGIAEPCRECLGRGLVVDTPCPTCAGSGRGRQSRTMQTRIPAGVHDGQRIRLKGKGAPGERGGPAGDLYVTVHVDAHPVFGRSGDHLLLTVPVTFGEAALGADVVVPTLDGGTVTLKVPAGTPSGRTFRVRGRGVRRSDGTTGDLLVTVEVQVPQAVSAAARTALEQFVAETDRGDLRADLLARARSAAAGGPR